MNEEKIGKEITAKAISLVKTKYELPIIKFDENKTLYVLNSNTLVFDRMLRRYPEEVYPKKSTYVIPLGYSCTEAVVSAYGLSNSTIYKNKIWIERLSAYQKNMCEQTAFLVLNYLHTAAVLKFLRSSNEKINVNNQFDLAYALVSVSEAQIINAFNKMVGE